MAALTGLILFAAGGLMKYKILRPLPYSADGIRIQALAAGSEHEIMADLVPGLVAEGYIAPVTPDAAPLDLEPVPARRPRGQPSPRR